MKFFSTNSEEREGSRQALETCTPCSVQCPRGIIASLTNYDQMSEECLCKYVRLESTSETKIRTGGVTTVLERSCVNANMTWKVGRQSASSSLSSGLLNTAHIVNCELTAIKPKFTV